jgi:energy-converting hydrogenase Eha subunit G
MPSLYTANGGIELPANGEQSGTWGETVNDNMSIIDRLTNGVGSISLSGTTHTLTTNNGILSDGQYKVLLLGGSPSGTNTVTVTPNTGQHIYIVTNSSGQTATFTQGSGGNVSVLNGTTKILSTNGAGGAAAVVDITATIDLGSLIIGGTTVTSSAAELNILDGVTATTAELNILDGVTASTAELNILDGVTATTAELNYVDGVTSAIQTQIDTKAPSTSPTLTSPTLASVITITGGTQSWTVTAAGTNLTFAYNSVNVMRIDSSGNFTVIGNVNTVGTIS